MHPGIATTGPLPLVTKLFLAIAKVSAPSPHLGTMLQYDQLQNDHFCTPVDVAPAWMLAIESGGAVDPDTKMGQTT
jgi:hypothetical protein